MKTNKWKALFWIAMAELFALSLWFSASVIMDSLTTLWGIPRNLLAWVSASVPIGFVVGAFFSSYVGLPDRFNPRKIFAVSALCGALLNLCLLFVDTAVIGILLRLLTGITLAGVYPTAVKIISLWFPTKRGLAIGILIAALTLGSSLPHLSVLFFSNVKWQMVIVTSSILAIVSSIIVYGVLQDAPYQAKKTVFSFSLIKKVIKNKPVMLANYGYFGHQWELYAMWTWLPSFLAASFVSVYPNLNPSFSALASFLTIGIAGAIGCIIGGYFADKIGRAQLTIVAMTVSGLCAIFIGFTFGKPIWLTFLVAFIWGVFVIADSAQFSASVSEFAEVEYVGTALTFQMCVGFLITIITINLVPLIQKVIGWEWVFTLLSIGPIFGIVSMALFKKYESEEQRNKGVI